MLTINTQPKHFHIIYVPDETWDRIRERSESENTSKSDAISSLLSAASAPAPAEEKPEPRTDYEKLKASLEILQKAIEAMEPPKDITFGEVAERFLTEKRGTVKSSTVRTYKQHINNWILPEFSDRNIAEITRQDILDFQARLSEAVQSKYTNEIIKTLKRIFKYALANEYIEKDVSANIASLPVAQSTARNTVHRALDKAKELEPFLRECAGEYLYLFICFVLHTGVRFGEAAALTAADIDENYIYINRTLMIDENNKIVMSDSPKTYSSRRKIPINNNIRKVLDQIEMPTDGSTIFKNRRGGFVTDSMVNQTIRRVLRRLEEKGTHIERFTCHAFRDTFATNYVRAHPEAAGDPKTLQELLGHARLSITTDLYVHVLDDSKVKGMKRMDEEA